MDTTDPTPSRRRLSLKIFDVEMAFESMASFDLGMLGESNQAHLDVETGEIVWPDLVEEDTDFSDEERFLAVPQQEDRIEYGDMEDFIATHHCQATHPTLARSGTDEFRGTGSPGCGGNPVATAADASAARFLIYMPAGPRYPPPSCHSKKVIPV